MQVRPGDSPGGEVGKPLPAERKPSRPGGRGEGVPLHARILTGLVLGGQVFLRMLFMVVVPLVFTSLVQGVTELGDVTRLGRMGLRTFSVFLATTLAAAILGLALVNVVEPGLAIDPEVRSSLREQFSGQAAVGIEAAGQTGFGLQTFVGIVPRNPVEAAARGDMLGLVF